MRSRIVRIGTLRIDFGLERIIPSHAYSPLSEKINFRKLKMRTNTYKCVFLRTITDKLRINSILLERIYTLRKFCIAWLYETTIIRFFSVNGPEY